MGLDTLPYGGRVMMLAVLLATALCALARRLDPTPGSSVNLLFRKGTLLALLAVPPSVLLIGVQMPVYVDEVVRFETRVPAVTFAVLMAIWLLGVGVVLVLLLRQWVHSAKLASQGPGVDDKLARRVAHWCQRISYRGQPNFRSGGSQAPWHIQQRVQVPAAILNWPMGLVDVVLLGQLALLKQRAWWWLLFGRLVQALYWPLPWVRTLVEDLAQHLTVPAARLAASAYRDPEGWQRDVRNFEKRAATLDLPPPLRQDKVLRLPQSDFALALSQPGVEEETDDDADFGTKWQATKARRASRHADPYEQAYWLIAAACIVIGIATTLTIVKTPPEFEPQFLQLRWEDQMGRRPEQYEMQDPRQGDNRPHPRGGQPPRKAGEP